MTPPDIESDRLCLRRMHDGDFERLLEMFSDEETMRFYPSTKDRAETESWIRRTEESYRVEGFGLWIAELKPDRIWAGQCGLLRQDVDGCSEIEVAYMIRRNLWRRGLASEAAAAVRDWALAELHPKRLISLIDPGNVASIRVATKIGMRLWKQTHKWDKDVSVYSVERKALRERN